MQAGTEFWKDLLQLGAQVSGYANWPLGILLLFIAAAWLASPTVYRWIKRHWNGPSTRWSRLWRRRVTAMLHALPIIGIVVGGFLFVGSIAWVLADNRRANEETTQLLNRYVLPRHLTEQQTRIIADYLSKFEPRKAKFLVAKNNEEASSYRSDFQIAIQQGGWTVGDINYSNDVFEGLSIEFRETTENSQKTRDSKHLKTNDLFRDAIKQAKVQLSVESSGSGGVNEDTFTINIGPRRMDDGDLQVKQKERERARRILEEEE